MQIKRPKTEIINAEHETGWNRSSQTAETFKGVVWSFNVDSGFCSKIVGLDEFLLEEERMVPMGASDGLLGKESSGMLDGDMAKE